MAEAKALTEKSVLVMEFLQNNEGAYFGDEIDAATGIGRGIHGVMNGLVKRELVQKEKVARTVTIEDKDGNAKDVEKEQTAYSLTEAGAAYTL